MTCLPMVTTKARVWPGLNGKRWIDLWNRTYTTEYHDKEKKMRKTIVILIAVVIVTLTVSLVAQATGEEPPPAPVGGLTYPNDTVHLLTPWIALAALSGLALAIGAVALRKRTG